MHVLKLRSLTVGIGGSVYQQLAKEIGGAPEALILRNDQVLARQILIHSNWKDMAGTAGAKKPLLTDLGMELFKRVEKYNAFKTREQTA